VVGFVEILLCILAVYGLFRNFHLFGVSYLFWFIVGKLFSVFFILLECFELTGMSNSGLKYPKIQVLQSPDHGYAPKNGFEMCCFFVLSGRDRSFKPKSIK
jgi:hypothetical protein